MVRRSIEDEKPEVKPPQAEIRIITEHQYLVDVLNQILANQKTIYEALVKRSGNEVSEAKPLRKKPREEEFEDEGDSEEDTYSDEEI